MAKNATATSRAFSSSVGVPENNRQALIALLNLRLADSTDLRSQVKWAHWNVKGLHFIQLHQLFDSLASHLEEQTDTIAERITTLGGVANGTVREAAAKSGLKEADLAAIDGPSSTRTCGSWRRTSRRNRFSIMEISLAARTFLCAAIFLLRGFVSSCYRG